MREKNYSAIFLDIAHAFDKVWHVALMNKLKNTLPRQFAQILESYITERMFCVKQEVVYCTIASCRTSLFYFHFLFQSLCGLSTFKTLYSVLNTCHFLKSSKPLHVSTSIGHPQVLKVVQ
jgi:hypothetical protein